MSCSALVFFMTELPKDVVKILVKELEEKYDEQCEPSLLHGAVNYNKLRNSYNAWVPDSSWVAGFIMHYVMKANQTNFKYDIDNIDGNHIQYTRYGPGQTYGWHPDHGINDMQRSKPRNSNEDDVVVNEGQRKLSFSLQLSEPDEYSGGNFQLIDDNNDFMIAPRQLGSLIVFDSRMRHKVCPVKTGTRRSLVGWVMGPRFR